MKNYGNTSDSNDIQTLESVKELIKQSDWNQNDETADDHIKNRICYEKSSSPSVDMLGTTLHTDSNSELVEKNFNGAFGFNPPIPFEPNVEYTLTIGDVSLPVVLSGSASDCSVYSLPHPNCSGQIVYSRHGVWGSSDYTALIMFNPDWQRLYSNKEIKLELKRGNPEIKTIEKKFMPDDTTYQQDLLASEQDINDIMNN